MSTLLPEGVDGLADCPFVLFDAIRVALRILSYFEWPPEERPPKRIWLDGSKLEAHWKRIDAERKRKYGGGESAADGGEWEENAAAMDLISRG